MNIGIIGSGNVGGTLGSRWAQNGHKVTFAARDPNSPGIGDLLSKAGSNAAAASNAETARNSEVIALTLPWDVVEPAVKQLDLSGKIVIDVMNPLAPDLSGLSLANTTSGAEKIAQWAPGAKVVKAFNTVGSNVMGNAQFEQGRVALFYCGDDPDAKKTVAGLITELGFEALDAGPLTQARVLEPFAMLWISLAVKYGYGRDIAFHFLRR